MIERKMPIILIQYKRSDAIKRSSIEKEIIIPTAWTILERWYDD